MSGISYQWSENEEADNVGGQIFVVVAESDPEQPLK
jgi:hypothetical protein